MTMAFTYLVSWLSIQVIAVANWGVTQSKKRGEVLKEPGPL